MNKYLISVCDKDFPEIISVSARSMEDAENKFMEILTNKFNIEDPYYLWDDFCEDLYEHEIYLGEIMDIEEF